MFVNSNTLDAVKGYFYDRLTPLFSASELRQMFFQVTEHLLKLRKEEVLLQKDIRLSESDLLNYRAVVKRLLAHEPFQHIIGSTYFCDLLLKTDHRALVPRPETEELVYEILNRVDDTKSLKILDLCTGTGCIALALKASLKEAKVYGVDVSESALSLAQENQEANQLDVHFFLGDVLTDFDPQQEKEFDVWVSNPPYIPWKEKTSMAENVVLFEPELALFVEDEDPLQFYRKIAELGLVYLKKDGLLAFEIHENYGDEMVHLLKDLHYHSIELKKDLQGKNRMMFAKK